MASNYEKILASIGSLYGNTDRSNKQERLRLLSTVALHAPNEMLKKFFRRDSKKGGVISVNEAEIVQAREYAKQFGAGVAVMPVGQGNYSVLLKVEPLLKYMHYLFEMIYCETRYIRRRAVKIFPESGLSFLAFKTSSF